MAALRDDRRVGGDGRLQLRGVAVLASKERPPHRRRCLYFDVDDSFWYHEARAFDVDTVGEVRRFVDGIAAQEAGETLFLDELAGY